MKLTEEQKEKLRPLIDKATETAHAAEDAQRDLARAVDVVKRALGAPANAILDHYAMQLCRKTGQGDLEPI